MALTFLFDAFNKIDFDKSNESELTKIKTLLTHLTMFAQMNNVILFLVVHPTKMRKNDAGIYDVPTLYDCSGSADFRNQTHDGFTIYRHFKDISERDIDENDVEFTTQKVKMKFQGDMLGKKYLDLMLYQEDIMLKVKMYLPFLLMNQKKLYQL